MKRSSMALFLAWALCTPSFAAQRLPLGEGCDGQIQVAVDLDSIQKNGSHVTVFEKFTYLTPAKYTCGRLIHAIKSNQSYDCEQRKTLLLTSFAYGDVEATVASERSATQAIHRIIPPFCKVQSKSECSTWFVGTLSPPDKGGESVRHPLAASTVRHS